MRKHKLDSVYLSEVSDMLVKLNNNGFYDFFRVPRKGLMLKLVKPLSDDDKKYIKDRYSNVMFFKMQAQYAPEIKRDAILITDKTISYLLKKGIIKEK